MIRKIIVSIDKNWLIGKEGKLPWYIPEELKFFKKTTMGSSIIMGRKTWDNLPKKPLPGRFNVVLSKSIAPNKFETNAFVSNWDEAWNLAEKESKTEDIFVIGGAEVYKEVIENNWVDTLIVSKVKGEYEGDTYFPKIDKWIEKLILSRDNFDVFEYRWMTIHENSV